VGVDGVARVVAGDENVEARVGQAGGDFLEVAGKDGFLRAIGVVVVNERAVSGQN
jgi:hypothetical protein